MTFGLASILLEIAYVFQLPDTFSHYQFSKEVNSWDPVTILKKAISASAALLNLSMCPVLPVWINTVLKKVHAARFLKVAVQQEIRPAVQRKRLRHAHPMNDMSLKGQ